MATLRIEEMNMLDILTKAESELREAIAEAARAGDYRAVDLGRSVAVEVQELCEKIAGHSDRFAKSAGDGTKKLEGKRHRKILKRNKPEGLPRFEVRNGSLLKIGWSRKQRCEYSHKVPKVAYDGIVAAMAGLAKVGNGPFTAEIMIERLNKTKEEIMPAYQVYVVVAALRAWNVISQIGREGYKIPADVAEKAQNMWTEVTAK